jgi:hypothetical protein
MLCTVHAKFLIELELTIYNHVPYHMNTQIATRPWCVNRRRDRHSRKHKYTIAIYLLTCFLS